jgi:hypothetical protein
MALKRWQPWQLAHLEATLTITRALNILRVVRPSWEYGQPIATANADECCEVCESPLYGASATDPQARERRMCSDACWRRYAQKIVAARLAAARAGARCEHCGQPIDRDSTHQRYCSKKCAQDAYHATDEAKARARARKAVKVAPARQAASVLFAGLRDPLLAGEPWRWPTEDSCGKR